MNVIRINSNNILRFATRGRYVILRNQNVFNHFNQRRNISVESTIKSQSGIFKTLSESAPVEYVQNFLLQVHDQSGLPWWATIVCTTIFLRACVTVPLAVYQQKIMARYENIAGEMPAIVEELKKEMNVAVRRFQWDERTAQYHYRRSVKKQWNGLIVRDNCHPMKAGLLVLFQIPLWVCYSVSLRNLVYQLPNSDVQSQITFLELSVGGFGWIPNLTVADAGFVLPVLLGVINLSIIEIQSLAKTKPPGKMQRFVTNFFRIVSVVMVPIAASVPSCLALYWTTSSAFGLMQNLVLMSPKVKRMFRVPITKSELPQPYSHVIEKFKLKMSTLPGFNK